MIEYTCVICGGVTFSDSAIDKLNAKDWSHGAYFNLPRDGEYVCAGCVSQIVAHRASGDSSKEVIQKLDRTMQDICELRRLVDDLPDDVSNRTKKRVTGWIEHCFTSRKGPFEPFERRLGEAVRQNSQQPAEICRLTDEVKKLKYELVLSRHEISSHIISTLERVIYNDLKYSMGKSSFSKVIYKTVARALKEVSNDCPQE